MWNFPRSFLPTSSREPLPAGWQGYQNPANPQANSNVPQQQMGPIYQNPGYVAMPTAGTLQPPNVYRQWNPMNANNPMVIPQHTNMYSPSNPSQAEFSSGFRSMSLPPRVHPTGCTMAINTNNTSQLPSGLMHVEPLTPPPSLDRGQWLHPVTPNSIHHPHPSTTMSVTSPTSYMNSYNAESHFNFPVNKQYNVANNYNQPQVANNMNTIHGDSTRTRQDIHREVEIFPTRTHEPCNSNDIHGDQIRSQEATSSKDTTYTFSSMSGREREFHSREIFSPRKRESYGSIRSSSQSYKKSRNNIGQSRHSEKRDCYDGERSRSYTSDGRNSRSINRSHNSHDRRQCHEYDNRRERPYSRLNSSNSNRYHYNEYKNYHEDRPLRCVSPPPPDVNRVIKFVVPEEFYNLSKNEQTSKSITSGSKKLEQLYETFKNTVLNATPATEGCDSQESLQEVKEPQAESNKVEDDDFKGSDFESSHGSEFGIDDKSHDEFSVADSTEDDRCEDLEDDISDSGSYKESSRTWTAVDEVRARKLADPRRLHLDLWFNEKGEGNDGPICRCCSKDRERGIQHAVYPGEKDVPICDPLGNNGDTLYHYWVTVTPHTNFMTERPTMISYHDKDYVFEGFSILSHQTLDKIPLCSLIRFNIEYSIHLIKEPIPKNFCIGGLEIFSRFLFSNVLELLDWNLQGQKGEEGSCPRFHFLPRFVFHRDESKNDKKVYELLSMDKVLTYLINSSEDLVKPCHLEMTSKTKEQDFAKSCHNLIVSRLNKKPAAFRIDDVLFESHEQEQSGEKKYPSVVHHGIRPVQMSYSGNPKYRKLWKSFVRLRNTLANRPVPSRKDQDRLVKIKIELQTMRLKSSMRRDVEVHISSEGLKKTGINSDICQHAMLLPVLVHHLRYHICLRTLDDKLDYKFQDRMLFQLALSHPSYHMNFGMNPDQARNTLTNCGVKEPRYGDRRIHRMHSKKKGITHLTRIMANQGKIEEHQSMIRHNERLEFLGDAVLEFICSSHLFFMLTDKAEGHLAMFRSALVQNSHLAQLAKGLNLSDYMQFAHGPDLCKDEDLSHAMANCFEALLGAIFLDGGLKSATELFTRIAFEETELRKVWINLPKHPLQIQQPDGDRHLISSSPVLQKLQDFEESTGITFTHIRLLAKAFTHPQVGFNNLTLGDNQRMEFLGDSVLQFIVSIYLYRHFPDHHEGHLTLLRSSLVNNRTQADIARQLGLDKYINFGSTKLQNAREKLLADVLEAFLAALYVDKGLKHVETFCRVCFFPLVEKNIVNQEWIDAKSQLQQCCLSLREEGKTPNLPAYKVLQDAGPAHHKKYQIGVYYKKKRCGTGEGNSIHEAEMAAARDALSSSYFPELARQKHLLDDKYRHERTRRYDGPSKPRARRRENEPEDELLWVQ